MEYAFLAGRLLFGGFFLGSGIKHFTSMDMMSKYAAGKNVPLPKVAIAVSGLLIILGGLGVILGYHVHYALALIILFLVPVTFSMHAYWMDKDVMAKAANRVNFYKNLALLGACLMMWSLPYPWPFSLIK